jgi:hypothetical protein
VLHMFFNKRPWFATRRYGYGAGRPIAWQGWLLILSYVSLLAGLGVLATKAKQAAPLPIAIVLLIATTAFLEISRRRTQGGWRWRWGELD